MIVTLNILVDTTKNIFQSDDYLEGTKMHSATSSEGSRLVRTVVPCAQTRVAIETHSQVDSAKRCIF